MPRFRAFLDGGLVVAALGCAPSHDPDPARQAAAAIVAGYASDDSDVVAILPATCTGTLIAPNLVLTAQHCVAPFVEDMSDPCGWLFAAPVAPNSLSVSTAPVVSANVPGEHAVVRVAVPTPVGTPLCDDDVALLVLASPIAPSEATFRVPRVDEAIQVGESFSAIGYGLAFANETSDTAERRRRDDVGAICIGKSCPEGVWPAGERQWQADAVTCFGDSGGPAVDGHGRAAGVISRVNGNCGIATRAAYAHLVEYASWIQGVALEAAAQADYDPPPWALGWPTDPAFSQPVGEPCHEHGDCPSGACIEGVCSRACNEQAPCPVPFLCGPVDGSALEMCRPPQSPTETSHAPEGSDGGCGLARGAGGGNAGVLLVAFWGLALRRRRAPR
jgi:hypothetical protein